MFAGPPPTPPRRVASLDRPMNRFFCVDDHPLFRAGLIALLEQLLGLQCVGESESEREAWETLQHAPVDLVVVDLRLREGDGMSLIQRLRQRYPDLKLVCLTMSEDPSILQRAKASGADLVLIKGSAPREVCTAIGNLVALAPSAPSPEIVAERPVLVETPLDRLSPREREVLVLMGQGYTTREIAAQLFLSTKTVETHRLRIKAKLRVNSLPELIRQAVHAANAMPDPTMRGFSATISHLADPPMSDTSPEEAPWDDADDMARRERTEGALSSHPSSSQPRLASVSEVPLGSFGIGPPGVQPPGRRWTGS